MADITLKPIQEEDIELVRSWRNSEEIAKYMYSGEKISEEQQKKWFNQIKDSPSHRVWIIMYNDSKVGLASLYDLKEKFKTGYWAFYLGDTSKKGGGIGAKVEFNICNYFFEELGYNKLLCEVFLWNEQVIKMHEKFGFRRESYFREHIFKDGKFQDVIGLALLRNEWKTLKGALQNKIYGSV